MSDHVTIKAKHGPCNNCDLCINEQRVLPVSQVGPLNPGGQMHSPVTSSHTPPLAQDRHDFVQSAPHKPALQPVNHTTTDRYSTEAHIMLKTHTVRFISKHFSTVKNIDQYFNIHI